MKSGVLKGELKLRELSSGGNQQPRDIAANSHLLRIRLLLLLHIDGNLRLSLPRIDLNGRRRALLTLHDVGVGLVLRHLLPLLRLVPAHSLSGLPLDEGGLGGAESLHVTVPVLDVDDGVRDDLVSHAVEVAHDALHNLARERLPVLVNLLDGQGTEDLTLVAFHGQLEGLGDLGLGLPEEVLGGEADVVLVGLEGALSVVLKRG